MRYKILSFLSELFNDFSHWLREKAGHPKTKPWDGKVHTIRFQGDILSKPIRNNFTDINTDFANRKIEIGKLK